MILILSDIKHKIQSINNIMNLHM